MTQKVLLIGWDAADWKVITPLLDAGKMPHLEKFVSQGVMGNLATLSPVLSPMLWTSIATGKRAYKHGIHGFSEPDPQGRGVRPVTNLGRKTKAVWNIFNLSKPSRFSSAVDPSAYFGLPRLQSGSGVSPLRSRQCRKRAAAARLISAY